MVRVYLKGGVWKNSEDEILKAAVQKYGKQQWARVASLLNKKTAKQAKARWHEWLDPSIRKTDWSRAEEEKLLHLAKLMPAQWKTIAPLVGRTATQCQEHYEALLDQATAAATATSSGDAARLQEQLRPGQINDAHPETKPARPDPVDMDEDELEMLQEARARLANTVGKKAKRKQREKMLNAAKRLADLQKRRELKQAGLIVANNNRKKKKRNKKEIDLGAEIPFYKPAPAGFHDTSQEVARTAAGLQKHLRQVDLKKVNESMYRTRDRQAAAAKKREEARMRVLEQSNQKYAAEKQKVEEPAVRRARGHLQLPAPTVTDTELVELAKLQQQQQQHPPPQLADGTGGATQALVGDYSDRPLPTPMRTPVVVANQQESLLRQASQLRQLERGQTPLLVTGAADHDDNNDDAVENEDENDRKLAATPGRAGVGRTPYSRRVDDAASVGASTFATRSIRDLARQERRAAKKARLELEAALAALPDPQYEYELAAPAEGPGEDRNSGTVVITPDQADVEAKQRAALLKEAEKLYEARSSVLKRKDLPRPVSIPDKTVDGDPANQLIQQELWTLLQHDAHAHPVAPKEENGSNKKKRKRKQEETDRLPAVELDYIPEESLQSAKSLVQQELDAILEDKIALSVRDEKASSREEAMEFLSRETMQARLPDVVYAESGWIEPKGDTDRIESLRLEFASLKEATEALRKKNDKVDSKLGVMTGGYVKRAAGLKQDILQTFAQVQNSRIEESVYSMLRSDEVKGGQLRIERLQKEIGSLRKVEAELQKRYGELLVEKRRAAVVLNSTS